MGDLASTRLTMLFSDIEGSTNLLNRLGPAYPVVLATHRRILRLAFERWRGREVGTEGDSFFVVFGSAADALAAAAEGQQALEAHRWPVGVRLRVRMGLHTGHPEPFEDNLVGLDVHLAARVSATAHGGQVVLTQATTVDTVGRLPPGTSLLHLGTHRLKDIVEPQHLCQLVVPGLPAAFPPLRSLGTSSTLPSAPGELVGRQEELALLSALLGTRDRRIVTLTGAGGSGKTRLAVAVAELLAVSVDAVHFVDLSSATEDSAAWSSLGNAMGRAGADESDILEYLHDREVLLVLDNLEQLPGSGAGLVSRLLAGTARPRILATSRRPLHIAGEQEFPVAPLSTPTTEGGRPTVAVADRADSVRLFVQQATLADPSFALTDDNVADIVAVCRRLEGLPLAIELAAARVRLLPPKALLDHLDEVLGLPLPGHPQRQQTLRATVEWGYRMVGPVEQKAFRALAAFGATGGTFEALAEVLQIGSALAVVSELLDAALIRTEDHQGGPRVRLLQPVRAVAHDLAVQAGDLDTFQRTHAQHFLALAERAGGRLKGPDAIAARAWLELEMDNLRAALDWALGPDTLDEQRIATGIRLCTALGWYWYVTGYDSESRRWLERASQAAAKQQGPQLADLLHSFALLLLQRGDNAMARNVLAKTLALWHRAHDSAGEAKALNSMGVAYRSLGDPDRARALLHRSIEIAHSIENLERQATALTNLALLEIDDGHAEAALRALAEAERIDATLGNAWGVAADRVNRVAALLSDGRTAEAVELLHDLADTVTEQGDPDLTLGVIELLAYAASTLGKHEQALRLAACADEQRTISDIPLTDLDRTFLDRQLALSREAMGDTVADQDFEGRSLTVEQALAQAATLTTA
ncbi:tetratricopeptide repeat protein [Nostocoides sp. F2B08]|uniref:ATP-binding protein n=1 Tax=Nostocoides sp. F2B08 TaxID=2653936 RepID=UPI00186B40EC|nr:tetratricopeptide repeat protein [Tetrasphaera sp. F2B08]